MLWCFSSLKINLKFPDKKHIYELVRRHCYETSQFSLMAGFFKSFCLLKSLKRDVGIHFHDLLKTTEPLARLARHMEEY